LAEIFPSRREAILEKGREIGWVRVEAGVHTPLAIYAGRVLGQALAESFLRDPKFQADLAAAKAEASAAQP
jgi:acid phosphatase (class A)